MPQSADNPKLAVVPRTMLARLRRRVRAYAWLQGLGLVIACIGLGFWASLLLDWFFEPPREFRAMLLWAGVLTLVGLLVHFIGRRAFARMSDANMAMLLERRFPQFNDSLLTAVDLGRDASHAGSFHPDMIARTSRAAAEQMTTIRLGHVFDPAPLRRSIFAALAMAASVVAFAVFLPESFGVWSRRGLLLSEELWPRRTRLEIVGFTDGKTKVARGADLEIIARADMAMPLVPKTVHVRARVEGGDSLHASMVREGNAVAGRNAFGDSLRASMVREGNAVAGRDAFQEYSHVFRGVLAPIEFELSGGDATLRGLRIEVVDSPTIDRMILHCQYPAYMARKPQDVPVIGVMQIPEGTQVTVEGRANKRLVRVDIESALTDPRLRPSTIDAAQEPGFRYPLGELDGDRTLLFSLLDADGIRGREPIRLALAAVADEPPELPIRLHGIGTAITPQARLPVVGRVADDYGIARAWFELAVNEAKPLSREILSAKGNPTDIAIDHALEVRDLNLKPDAKLVLCVKAADRRDRKGGPNIGASQRWQLDVVTPDRLRLMLQSRELLLRQRFEMIVQETTDTRDALLRIDFDQKKAAKPAGGKPEGAEPGDAPPAAAVPESAESALALRGLHCERAVQNCRKNAEETLGTAEAFDAIRLELINNRIDTEELKTRLASGIAEPLRQIGDRMFPELEKRLVQLRKSLGDATLGPRDRDFARQQVDAILVAMNQVLSRMIELEDFNEAIQILREIIDSQKQLGDRTRQRQKDSLRDLLEDKP